MSSIIKGGRIGQETVINLQERIFIQTEYITQNVIQENLEEGVENLAYAKTVQETVEMIAGAKQEVNMLLAQANTKANNLIEESKLQCQKLMEETQAQAQAILEQAKFQKNQIYEEALKEKEACIQEAELEMVEVIQKLVSYIIDEKVCEHTQWILLLVKKMLTKEQVTDNTTLYLSERLYSKISRKYEDAFAALKVNLKQDATLSEKACVLETNQGSICYDVEEGLKTVLEEIKALQNLQVGV